MHVVEIAEALLVRAVDCGQAVVRCDATTPVTELRATIRRLARQRGVRIRTGMVADVLAVVTLDAQLWHDSTADMRTKLSAPPEPGVVA